MTLEEIDEFCHVNGGRVQGNEYEQLMEDALGSVEALSVRKPIPSMRGLGARAESECGNAAYGVHMAWRDNRKRLKEGRGSRNRDKWMNNVNGE